MVNIIIAAVMLILDQITKFYAARKIALDTGIKPLIPGVIQMTNVRNTGAAFGFLPGGKIVLLVFLAVFTAVVVFLLWKRVVRTPFSRFSLLLMLAGALGNGVDRLIYGYVTDMFEFLFLPNIIFNLADCLITLGAILFCISVLASRGRSADDEDDEDEDGEDDDDDDDDEDEKPRRGLFSRRRRDDDDDEDEDDEDEEPVKKPAPKAAAQTAKPAQRPAAPAQRPQTAAPARQAPAQGAASARPVRPAAANAQAVRSGAPAAKAQAPAQQRAAAPAQRPQTAAPAAKPAPKAAPAVKPQPVQSDDDFDLDAILAEFK